jgi:hypothetical protein
MVKPITVPAIIVLFAMGTNYSAEASPSEHLVGRPSAHRKRCDNSSSETCQEVSACRWPSCRQLHDLRLIRNETGEACAPLSAEIKSFGVLRHGSADTFIEYLKEDHGGILDLAGRRIRIKADVDAAATAAANSVSAAKAALAAKDKAQIF